jgi:mannose-6-phosphate isomerase-like protein (cupin superfamily)
MFTLKAAVILDEFKRYQPEIFQSMQAMIRKKDQMTYQNYGKLPNISIDHAIMEKTARGAVLPSEFGWSDIGSWKSLYEFLPKGDYNNVIDGDVIARNTENCFILGRDRLIATNYIKNLVVVETPDSVFVSDLDNSRDVKSIVESLQAAGRREYKQHTTVYQSWGNTTLLEQHPDYTVKRMNIYPGEIAELNRKKAQTRSLTVISGTGRIESPAVTSRLKKGQTFLISAREKTKIENSGEIPLCIIEIEMVG